MQPTMWPAALFSLNSSLLPHLWPRSTAHWSSSSAAYLLSAGCRLTCICDGQHDQAHHQGYVRREKLTARAYQAALNMARIRKLEAGELLVGHLLLAAFIAVAPATCNHAAELLPSGICTAENIFAKHRERLSGMQMMSTSAECLFALGRAHNIRAGAIYHNNTNAGVILGHADGTAANCGLNA
eukprot:1349836-Pleurochrysis_carterae.AAC.3